MKDSETWFQTQKKKKIWNKLWIIKSRGFKIKNKILPYDILKIKTFSTLILTHFKSESSGFLMFEGVRNGALAKLNYQSNSL